MGELRERTCIRPNTTEDSTRPVAARPRPRALLIGLLAVVEMCFVGPYADMVGKSMQLGTLQFAPGAFGAFAVIVALNWLYYLVRRHHFLSSADLFVVCVMVFAGVFVCTRGVMEKLISPLVFLNYYANPQNRYEEKLLPFVRRWLVVFDPNGPLDQEAVRGYFEGVRGHAIPYSAWLKPLAAWGVVLLAVVVVFVCVASLLRRQWVEHERLVFPLTEIPFHISDELRARDLLKSRLTWIGIALPVFVYVVNGLHTLQPGIPQIPLWIPVNQYFPNKPFSGMFFTMMWISFGAMGFAYFLASDLLLSLWFFFVVTRVEDIIATALGYNLIGMPNFPTRLYIGYQVAAAYVVLAAYLLWTGRSYVRRLWKQMLRGDELDESQEMLPTRVAVGGLVLGFAAVIAWTMLAGVTVWLAVVAWLIYFLVVALILARSVCEGGLMMCEISFKPIDLIGLAVPRQAIGASNLVPLAFLDAAFFRDLRGLFLAGFLDDQKLARRLKVEPRRLLAPVLAAIVVAYIAGAFSQLYLNYHRGNITLYGYPTANAQWAFDDVLATLNNARTESGGALPAFAVGGIVTVLLVYLRAHVVWWPFHPLGYALAPSYTMWVIWFPCFLTWILKSLILRYGGMKVYRQAMPFFLGLILGEFGMGVFWATFATVFQKPTPQFPWGG